MLRSISLIRETGTSEQDNQASAHHSHRERLRATLLMLKTGRMDAAGCGKHFSGEAHWDVWGPLCNSLKTPEAGSLRLCAVQTALSCGQSVHLLRAAAWSWTGPHSVATTGASLVEPHHIPHYSCAKLPCLASPNSSLYGDRSSQQCKLPQLSAQLGRKAVMEK